MKYHKSKDFNNLTDQCGKKNVKKKPPLKFDAIPVELTLTAFVIAVYSQRSCEFMSSVDSFMR